MKKISTVILIVILLLALTACGILGGGGTTTTTTTATPDNDPPITQEEPQYSLNPDGESYTLVSIGKPEGTEIVVPSEYDGKPVTVIGKGAFSRCRTLTGITLPEGITTIGDEAFSECNSLVEIAIPDSVTGIGKNVFPWCGSLMTVTVGENNVAYTSIDGILYSKDGTTLIRYPSAKSGEAFTVPDTVLSISDHAFEGCESLVSVTVPNSVTSIGLGAFERCIGLESITLPFVGSKAEIDEFVDSTHHFGYIFGARSYEDNGDHVPSSLKNVVICGGKMIGRMAFYKCTGIRSVTVSGDIEYIYDYVFKGCSGLEEVCWNTTAYFQTTTPNLFEDCTALRTLTIGEDITYIRSYTFYNLTSLESVVIPDNITAIENHAFYGCSSLSSVSISDSVMKIDEYAFARCTALRTLTVPDSVTSISSAAFEGCTSLESITLPFIGGYRSHFGYIFGALSYNKNSDCVPKSLREVVIMNASTISDYAFSGCDGITDITIKSDITSIGEGAFSGCASLKSVKIPEGVTSIGSDAFKDCTGLETVYWNATECTQTGATWKYIFSTCTSLKTVMIGEGVRSIPTAAFRECKALKTVKLPHSIVSIGNFAFFDCTLLTDIYYDGTTSEWNALAKGTRWDANIEKYTVHCTDGDIEIISNAK